MQNAAKTEMFETMPIPRAVMNLAIPTIISSLVMVIYNMADTYFVGLLNDPVETAAVTLAATVLLAFNAVNNLFGVGSSSMMSRALGCKDYETVGRSSSFGFTCALASGILFSILYTVFSTQVLNILGADEETFVATANYLRWTTTFGAAPAILNVVMAYLVRAEGNSLHASIGTMSGCLLNIILDPLFILPSGLGMGAAGAGCATFISNCVACCYFFILLFVRRGKTYICINPLKANVGAKTALGICGVGVPASIQNLLNVTGMTVLNNFAASYGSDAVAAIGISQKLNMIPLYVALGVSQGIMPLVSYNYAAKNYKRMKGTVKFSATVSVIFMLIVTVFYRTFAGTLISLFIEDAAVVAYGTRILRGMCLAQTFLCVDFLAVGVFQACGMGKKALVFAILRKIVLEIPALIILNAVYPYYGLAYAQLCAEVVLATVAVVVLLRLFKGLEKETPVSA